MRLDTIAHNTGYIIGTVITMSANLLNWLPHINEVLHFILLVISIICGWYTYRKLKRSEVKEKEKSKPNAKFF